jgi:hypothetical protein
VLGSECWAKLILFLVLARVAAQGSRRSAVRWATQHAVAETLGLQHFDEDDLYTALDRLAEEQEHIEDALYRRAVRQRGSAPTVVLYDVTSSYLEGEQNELAAFGYNRDKKPGIGRPNWLLSVDWFLASRCQSCLCSAWRRSIFRASVSIRTPQWSSMVFFITV